MKIEKHLARNIPYIEIKGEYAKIIICNDIIYFDHFDFFYCDQTIKIPLDQLEQLIKEYREKE
jgi:hypothetical protein